MRVLWVEDAYGPTKDFFDEVEAEFDADIHLAESVAEALRRIDELEYDRCVLDLKLPLGYGDTVDALEDTDYNAIHIVQYLQQRGLLPTMRTICLTNYDVVAKRMFEGLPITVVSKLAYLADFIEVIR